MTYFEYVNAIWASQLPTASKILALAIASHYNWTTTTECWASNNLLSKETGLAIRSISAHKRQLCDAGFITITQRFNNSSNISCVLPEA